jgi:hypothetical protein
MEAKLYVRAGSGRAPGVREDLRQVPHPHIVGRQGNPDERPTLISLSEADQKFISDYNGRVPPLTGKAFFQRWGAKTAAQLVARFQEAWFSFTEAGLTDDEDIVKITAYVLKMNAKAGNQAVPERPAP